MNRLLAADGKHAAGQRAAAIRRLADAGDVPLLAVVETGFPLQKSKTAGDDADHVAHLMADLMGHAHDAIKALGFDRFRFLTIKSGHIAGEQYDAAIRLA
ncbi:roadblock/LC7 domain-containing protein [Agrobacterium salinitolerans]